MFKLLRWGNIYKALKYPLCILVIWYKSVSKFKWARPSYKVCFQKMMTQGHWIWFSVTVIPGGLGSFHRHLGLSFPPHFPFNQTIALGFTLYSHFLKNSFYKKRTEGDMPSNRELRDTGGFLTFTCFF